MVVLTGIAPVAAFSTRVLRLGGLRLGGLRLGSSLLSSRVKKTDQSTKLVQYPVLYRVIY